MPLWSGVVLGILGVHASGWGWGHFIQGGGLTLDIRFRLLHVIL